MRLHFLESISEELGSRDKLGFRVCVIKALALFILGVAVLTIWETLSLDDAHFSVQTKKAWASASLNNQSLSHTQKRYLKRALVEDQDNLLKLTGFTILEALSKPELIRHDEPTTLWQYRSENCVLDVYFVSDQSDPKDTVVQHYEVRARSSLESSDIKAGLCVSSIVEEASSQVVHVNRFYKSAVQ